MVLVMKAPFLKTYVASGVLGCSYCSKGNHHTLSLKPRAIASDKKLQRVAAELQHLRQCRKRPAAPVEFDLKLWICSSCVGIIENGWVGLRALGCFSTSLNPTHETLIPPKP